MLLRALFFLVIGCSGLYLKSQSVAADWTKTDCSSNSHTLFTYLNANDVVIIEFGMGCSSCTDAAGKIIPIRDYFNTLYPSRTKAFYMDYWTGNNCATEVVPVVGTYGFDAMFDHSQTEMNYYMSGSPMPGIVIVAGTGHDVIYEKNNFSDPDTALIFTVIDSFFQVSGIAKPSLNNNNIAIYPNPSENSSMINLKWNKDEVGIITIIDNNGKVVMSKKQTPLLNGSQLIKFDNNLQPGLYIVEIKSATFIYHKFLVIEY